MEFINNLQKSFMITSLGSINSLVDKISETTQRLGMIGTAPLPLKSSTEEALLLMYCTDDRYRQKRQECMAKFQLLCDSYISIPFPKEMISIFIPHITVIGGYADELMPLYDKYLPVFTDTSDKESLITAIILSVDTPRYRKQNFIDRVAPLPKDALNIIVQYNISQHSFDQVASYMVLWCLSEMMPIDIVRYIMALLINLNHDCFSAITD